MENCGSLSPYIVHTWQLSCFERLVYFDITLVFRVYITHGGIACFWFLDTNLKYQQLEEFVGKKSSIWGFCEILWNVSILQELQIQNNN